MKTALIAMVIILAIPLLLQAQGLNQSASFIKDNFSTEYESTIRASAIQDWGDDFTMVVYEINQQAESLFELVREFESEHTDVAFRAIQEWSRSGERSSNVEKFRQIDTFGVEQLISLHCDWTMVKYEYDQQVGAKGSF